MFTSGSGFPQGECYTAIQGTSMATPHAVGAMALSATDTSGGDLTGGSCPTGYCHLGGPRISDSDAYGAGLGNSARP